MTDSSLNPLFSVSPRYALLLNHLVGNTFEVDCGYGGGEVSRSPEPEGNDGLDDARREILSRAGLVKMNWVENHFGDWTTLWEITEEGEAQLALLGK